MLLPQTVEAREAATSTVARVYECMFLIIYMRDYDMYVTER